MPFMWNNRRILNILGIIIFFISLAESSIFCGNYNMDSGNILVWETPNGYPFGTLDSQHYWQQSTFVEYSPTVDSSVVHNWIIPANGSNTIASDSFWWASHTASWTADYRYLMFTGFKVNAGVNGDSAVTTAGEVPRIVASLSRSGTVQEILVTNATNFNYNVFGHLAAVNQTLFYYGDQQGELFLYNSGTSTLVYDFSPWVGSDFDFMIFGGQLYVGTDSGISALGSGYPTTTITTVTEVVTTNVDTFDYSFVDADPSVPGIDTVYAIDIDNGGVMKYCLLSGNWTSMGEIFPPDEAPPSNDIVYVAALVFDDGVHVFINDIFANEVLYLIDTTTCTTGNPFSALQFSTLYPAHGTITWSIAPIPQYCNDDVSCTYDGYQPSKIECLNLWLDERCNDNNNCTIDTCDPILACNNSGCLNTLMLCDDGIPCTTDYCENGVCYHTANNCSDGIRCTVDSCNTNEGYCTNIANDTLCDDNNKCTIDKCEGVSAYDGGCTYEDVECFDDLACTADTCDPTDGCKFTTEDYACDDDISCTVDTCSFEFGCRSQPVDSNCDDSNQCTIDVCDPVHNCEYYPVVCDDHIFCTEDSCIPDQGCKFTVDDKACDDESACDNSWCDTNLGRCVNIPDDSYCDDSNPCTNNICNAGGFCEFPSIDCADEIWCTVDSCNTKNGECEHKAENSLCNDGISFTVDVCDTTLGRCTNTPQDSLCDDHDPCTVDHGDLTTGECVHRLMDCSDDIKCTIDQCVQGICVHQADHFYCIDDSPCTIDECNIDRGECTNIPHSRLCDDYIDCTNDFCSREGPCVYEPNDLKCDDNIQCTTDICDPVYGCLNLPNNEACDDGFACTSDSCDTLLGCVNTPYNTECDDGFACTTDICDILNGCVHFPHDYKCRDGIFCTDDSCSVEVGCVNTPLNSRCDDSISSSVIEANVKDIGCTADVCNKELGVPDSCVHTTVGEYCSDGMPCSNEWCSVDDGCHIDLTDCPTEEKRICINCKSANSRIENAELTDESGLLDVKNRILKTLPNIVSSPVGEMLGSFQLKNDKFLVTQSTQQAVLSEGDTLVIPGGQFRLEPSPNATPDSMSCNEITRGQMFISEDAEMNLFWICLRTTLGYEWKNINTVERNATDDYGSHRHHHHHA